MSIPLRRYLDSITNIYTLPTYLSTDDTAATEAADGATIDGTYVRKLQPLEKSNFLDIMYYQYSNSILIAEFFL